MKTSDYKYSHLRNLIKLAAADGIEDGREIKFIHEVMAREELTESDLDYCKKYADSIPYTIPESLGERMEFLHDMIQLMMYDGDCNDREMELCKECAQMMEIPSRDTDKLVDNMVSLIANEMKSAGTAITFNGR